MSYQYETSPRKYEPEYHARPKKKKQKTTKKVSNTKKSKKSTHFSDFFSIIITKIYKSTSF